MCTQTPPHTYDYCQITFCTFTKVSLILCLFLFNGCNAITSNKLVFNKKDFEDFNLDSVSKMDSSFILFKQKTIDFGVIKKKNISKVLIYFPYVNIGYAELVLVKADVSCNCLTATYPIYPLSRGEVGVMEVLIDLKNLQGVFNKNIFIKSNAVNDIEIIRIKGIIEK